MAGSVNKHLILGRLGKDPEIRSFPSGGKVANFSVATSTQWKDRDGNKQEKTVWHDVACFNEGLVGIIERYLKKGSQVYIEGEIQKRNWEDRDGNKRVSVETVIPKFGGTLKLLDSKQGSDQSRDVSSYQDNQQGQSGGYDSSVDDDPIPF